MKNINSLALILVTLVGVSTFATTLTSSAKKAAVQPTMDLNSRSKILSDKNLMEELTGKKTSSIPAAKDLRKAPLPVQHYFAGQRAATEKNYILAIKHFNTVIQKYPQSAQAPNALIAKAQIYKEMGLQPQAERNLKLAQIQKKAFSKSLAQTQNKNKIIK